LEGEILTIDRPEYHIRETGTLLGILVHIMGGPKIEGGVRAA
jgi:hypothetical protein